MAKRNEFKTHFTADTSSFNKGLSSVKKGIAGIAGIATGVLAPIVAIGGAIGGIGLAIKGVQAAADLETTTNQFITLLGSVQAANEHIAMMRKLAVSTPLAFDDLAQASAQVHEISNGALSSAEGLKLIGDAALGANKPITELAPIIGKLHYQITQVGKVEQDVFNQLIERGVKLGDTIDKVREAQSKGLSGDQVWDIMESGLKKSSGAMERASKSFNGLISTLKDGWNDLLIEFGKPVMNALKPIIAESTRLLGEWKSKAKEVGEHFGDAISIIWNAFKDGQLWNLARLGLTAAFKSAANVLISSLIGGVRSVADLITSDFSKIAKPLEKIFANRSLFTGLMKLFTGFGKLLTAAIMEGLPTWMQSGDSEDIAKRVIELRSDSYDDLDSATNHLRTYSGQVATAMTDLAEQAGNGVQNVNRNIQNELKKDHMGSGKAWKKFFKESSMHVGAKEDPENDKDDKGKDKVATPKGKPTDGILTKANRILSAQGVSAFSGSDLTSIGGARGTAVQSLTNLQQRANDILLRIEKNTAVKQRPILG